MPDSLIERLRAALADRYAIERQAGEGGMATVFLATDLRHQRKVALKVLRPELAATLGPERFLQEVRVTANLQHPHILPLFDSGEADGFLYYVMPYLDGESLRERIAREGELPVGEVVRILTEVVDALAAAHAQGVVHRDIKPDNVLLSGRHAVVTDFGVAKAVSEATGRHQLTTAGVALGTPAYMAPEQAAAEEHIDHRADIYAVGVMGYELLTGRPPFSGRSAQQMLAAQVTERPQRLTELRPATPPALEALIMRCLEKKPADRWQRAEALLAQLEQFATPSAGMTPTQMRSVPARPKGGVPTWAKVATPVVVLGAALAVWATTRNPGAREGATAGTDAAAGDTTEARLLVMPFQVLGGADDNEAVVWSQLAAEWVARGIDGLRPVEVVPAATVRDALQSMGANAPVADVANRLGARYAVAGTMARTGRQVRFEVEFLDESTGARLRSMAPVVGPADSMEAVVGRLADEATATSVVLFAPGAPPWSARTSAPPSLEAYQGYLSQADLFCRGQQGPAIEAGNRVLARAPDFIPVLQFNQESYRQIGRRAEADSVRRILLGLSDRMTETERAFQAFLSGSLDGDAVAISRGAERLFQIAPSTWGITAGVSRSGERRWADALEAFLAMDMDVPCYRALLPWWWYTSHAYHMLGRYDDQLAFVRRGLEAHPGDNNLLWEEGNALAAMGRAAGVDSVLDRMVQAPQGRDGRPFWIAAELRNHGHEQEAADLFTRLLAPFEDPSFGAAGVRALGFYAAERWDVADTALATLLKARPTRPNGLANLALVGRRGVTLAELGRRDEALSMSARLAADDGSMDEGTRLSYRAMIAAALGDKDDAVRFMKGAFDHGLLLGPALHVAPAFAGMRGYGPWEALMAPR